MRPIGFETALNNKQKRQSLSLFICLTSFEILFLMNFKDFFAALLKFGMKKGQFYEYPGFWVSVSPSELITEKYLLK